MPQIMIFMQCAFWVSFERFLNSVPTDSGLNAIRCRFSSCFTRDNIRHTWTEHLIRQYHSLVTDPGIVTANGRISGNCFLKTNTTNLLFTFSTLAGFGKTLVQCGEL